MNTATKIAHLITIFLILSAFIVAPVVASAENDEFVNTRTETKTQSNEEINAIFVAVFMISFMIFMCINIFMLFWRTAGEACPP